MKLQPAFSGVVASVFSVGGVLLQVAVRGAPLPELCGVGQAPPAAVSLAPHAVGAAQLGQPLGGGLRVLRGASVAPLCPEVVPQVFQVQRPRAQLLPVHPLEGHDAVQVPAHLRPTATALTEAPSLQTQMERRLKSQAGEPFSFCAAGSPSPCGECPGILGSVC